jgi:hypothetical protein
MRPVVMKPLFTAFFTNWACSKRAAVDLLLLFELDLRRSEVLGAQEIDALVVNFESRIANLLSQRVALN